MGRPTWRQQSGGGSCWFGRCASEGSSWAGASGTLRKPGGVLWRWYSWLAGAGLADSQTPRQFAAGTSRRTQRTGLCSPTPGWRLHGLTCWCRPQRLSCAQLPPRRRGLANLSACFPTAAPPLHRKLPEKAGLLSARATPLMLAASFASCGKTMHARVRVPRVRALPNSLLRMAGQPLPALFTSSLTAAAPFLRGSAALLLRRLQCARATAGRRVALAQPGRLRLCRHALEVAKGCGSFRRCCLPIR